MKKQGCKVNTAEEFIRDTTFYTRSCTTCPTSDHQSTYQLLGAPVYNCKDPGDCVGAVTHTVMANDE